MLRVCLSPTKTVIYSFLLTLLSCFRWGQTYILEALLYYVPQENGNAEILAERITPRLQHANSAVVLTSVKVIVYLMNYMEKEEDISNLCRKLSPPLGKSGDAF